MLLLARAFARKNSFKCPSWPNIVFWMLCLIPVLHVCLLVTIADQNNLIQLLRPLGTCAAAGMLFYTAYLEHSYKRWAWIGHRLALLCAALFSYLKISQGASIIMASMRGLWILIYLFSFVGTALYLQRRAWWIGSTWRIIVGGLSIGMSVLVIMQTILPRSSASWPWTIQAHTVIPSLAFDVTNYYTALVIRKLNRALRHFDTTPSVTRLEVTESITHIKHVLADTRVLSFTLSNGPVQPLTESIRLLAPDDDRLSVTLIVTGATYRLPDNVAFTAYCIAQEAVANVIKHAPSATQIAVMLAYQLGQFSITITDHGDGTAAQAPSPTASGLVGMQERVEQVGGTLAHGPTIYGYRIHADLPTEFTHDSDSRVDCG